MSIRARASIKSVALTFLIAGYSQIAFGQSSESDALRASLADTTPTRLEQSDTPARAPMKLQGRAEVQQYNPIAAWQASQAYRQGVSALALKDYNAAAIFFKQAGDGFSLSIEMPGAGRCLASCRFAEAQARKLLNQKAEAIKLFAQAAELFRQYDPGNSFLKIAIAQAQSPLISPKPRKLQGKASKAETGAEVNLQSLPAMMHMVDSNIPLKGKITQLEDGTRIADLKENDFFTGGLKRLVPQAAGTNVSDAYVRKTVYKAFVDMNCLEFAELGGNYYTAPDSYKAFKASGQNMVIGASNELWSPVLQLHINGRQYGVCMDLPGMSSSSHNVMVVTDGQHVLAIDPRTNDTWKLMASFKRKVPDFNWLKLTHIKKK